MAATIIPDTHQFVKRLVESGMPTEQAEALKTELSDNITELATRKDLDAAVNQVKLFVMGANGVLGVLIIVLQVFGE